jgi:integrase
MPKIALEDTVLRKLPAPEKGQADYWDHKLPSFGVRVSQGGSKTFVLNRQGRRITLGRYPLLTLSEARSEARRMLAEFTLGKIRPQSVTYGQAVQMYLVERRKIRRARTVDDYEWLLGLFPFKGQLSEFTQHDTERYLKKIKSPSTYNHALTALKIFCNWAKSRRYLSENPVVGISAHVTHSRTRILTNTELAAVWRVCNEENQLSHTYQTIVKLLICLGSRRGEIAALRWSWIAEDRIQWPANAMKNSRPHWLPLCPLTKSILTTVPRTGDLLFPARGKTEQSWHGFQKAFVGLKELSDVDEFCLHDVRRTWASANAAWAPPHVLERALAHAGGTISGVAAVYNRYHYENELTDCYTRWEQHLRQILDLK